MKRVLTAEAMRNLDAHIINETGTPGSVLMENAAHALFRHVLCHINSESRVLIICGKVITEATDWRCCVYFI